MAVNVRDYRSEEPSSIRGYLSRVGGNCDEGSYLREAFQDWEQLSFDEETRPAYEIRLKEVLDRYSVRREVELREQMALEKGKEEGEIEIAKKMITDFIGLL